MANLICSFRLVRRKLDNLVTDVLTTLPQVLQRLELLLQLLLERFRFLLGEHTEYMS